MKTVKRKQNVVRGVVMSLSEALFNRENHKVTGDDGDNYTISDEDTISVIIKGKRHLVSDVSIEFIEQHEGDHIACTYTPAEEEWE